MNKLWTVYDDVIDSCERELRQLEVLISIEKWKDINERVREANIEHLTRRFKKIKRELNKNIKLRKASI
jgi:hypothetical protein